MMDRALGIYREGEFSPGKVGADAAILDAVLAHLAGCGIHTAAVSPVDLINDQLARFELILAMCQSEQALARLTAAQARGALVINSPQAIRSCYRDRLGHILKEAGSPVPDGKLVETAARIDLRTIAPMDPGRGIYVKRGDLHALFDGDVRRVDGHSSLESVLKDFAGRGIRRAYLQAAVEGRVVKFYGVTGSDYFSIADADNELVDSVYARLGAAAQHAARALGLEVWGGDAILSGDQFKIVDFNDWPSFERVREQAARAIARRVLQVLREEKTEKRN